MNVAHNASGKLAKAGEPRGIINGSMLDHVAGKVRAQSGNLSDAAARALQGLRQAIVENPADASLRQMLDSFARALRAYNDGIDKDPARAAAQFGEEIDRIVADRQVARSLKASLSKGMSPADFWRR
jgi:hypothetical protein